MDRAHFLYQVLVPKVKSITGISDISLFRKRIKKRFGKLIYTKKYTATDLINIMCEMGMHEGSVVCIHSSMMEFYNYQGTAQEFIDAILKVIGSTGTLMMPAFPAASPSSPPPPPPSPPPAPTPSSSPNTATTSPSSYLIQQNNQFQAERDT